MRKIYIYKNGLFKWTEKRKRTGIFKIFEINKYTKKTEQIDEINNLITNVGLNKEIDIFQGIAPDMHIKYLGTGDDNTAVTASDTILGNELFRSFYISQSRTGTGEVRTDFYLADTDSNFEIEELGIFAGVGATATTNSGNMLSHVLWNYTKTSAVEILVRRVDTVS